MTESAIKDPAAELDYSFDWSLWLATDDVIVTSTWVATEGLVVMDAPPPANTGTLVTVWIGGGTAGHRYRVTNTIETAAARVDERTLIINVQEK